MGTGVNRRGAARREAIIEAAMELWAETGSRGAILSAVARRAGVTHAGLLHHFGTKENLLLRVVAEQDRRDLARFEPAFARGGIDTLRELPHIARSAEEHLGLSKLYLVLQVENLEPDGPAHDYYVTRQRTFRRMLTNALRSGQTRGEIHPDIDPEAVAAEIHALMEGANLLRQLDPTATDQIALYEDFIGRLLRDLTSPPQQPLRRRGATHAPRHSGPDSGKPSGTDNYLRQAASVLDKIATTQADALDRAAQLCADAIGPGHLVYVFGTGTSRHLVDEFWPRHGSYPGFHPIVEQSLTTHQVTGVNGQRQATFLENVSGLAAHIARNFQLQHPDALIAISADNPSVVTTEFAEITKNQSLPVIAITRLVDPAHTSPKTPKGKRLRDIADIVIDTCTPVEDTTIPDIPNTVGSSTTVAVAAIINALKIRTAELLVTRNTHHPPQDR